MSDVGGYTIDPQILNLFQQAAGSRTGAGRVADNLDSIYLAYLSGGLNPQTLVGSGGVGGGSSELMDNWASDPNPAIQQVIEHIRSGTDPYRLSSFVDAVIANNTKDVQDLGLQPDDFKSLALNMNKQYSGESDSSGSSGSKGRTNFAKAGFSNPLDTYDASNAPLNDAAVQFIMQQQQLGQQGAKDFVGSQQKVSRTFDKLEETPELMSREYSGDRLARLFEKGVPMGRYATGSGLWSGAIRASLANWLDSQNGPVTEAALNKKIKEFRPTSGPEIDQKMYDKAIKEIKGKVSSQEAVNVSTDTSSAAFQDFRRQIDASRRAAFKQNEAGRQEMATRQGAADAANAAGQTPFGDEIKKRLALLASLGK